VVLGLLVTRALAARDRASAAALSGAAAAAAFLLALEAVQGAVGREASWGDAWAGTLGAAAGGALFAARRLGGGARRALLACAGAAAALAVLPSALVLLDVAWAHAEHPRLGSFEQPLEMGRWAFDGAHGERSAEHATHGERSLRVDLEPGHWPSAMLRWPPPDWTGRRVLAFDAWLAGDEALPLVLKVVDRWHDGTYEDRSHVRISLQPGANAVRVALATIERAPARRPLDLERVAALQLFAEDLARPRTVWIDHVRLE
jgi:hypothetical protein